MDKNQSESPPQEIWASGEAYEPYVGRWSRIVASQFLKLLRVPEGSRWLDVGCGTGALTQTILRDTAPQAVEGVDRSEGYVAYIRKKVTDSRATFKIGDAQALPVETSVYDAVVSALVLNFVAKPELAVREMVRAAKPGGLVAAYVWDYAGKMQFMRHFWNAAAALDPAAAQLDEGRRFPLGNPGPLASLFQSAGLSQVEVQPIDIWTDFKDFDDFWLPFLGSQGPAPGYVRNLDEAGKTTLRERIRLSLPFALDGSIPLMARAWAVCGVREVGSS